jgi:hypothetical protein
MFLFTRTENDLFNSATCGAVLGAFALLTRREAHSPA